MKKPMVRIYTGNDEFIDREMNDDEFAQYEIDKKDAVNRKKEAETKAAEKQAILDRIGLTVDELKTILG
jgi:hypothetical protein